MNKIFKMVDAASDTEGVVLVNKIGRLRNQIAINDNIGLNFPTVDKTKEVFSKLENWFTGDDNNVFLLED